MAHAGEELGLALARLRQLTAFILDFVEQPHVLDGDRRLVGESLDQRDLFVGKRLNFVAPQSYKTDQNSLAKQRHAKQGPVLAEPLRFEPGEFRVGKDVRDLDRL